MRQVLEVDPWVAVADQPVADTPPIVTVTPDEAL
jgi:hypothetical protein